MQSSYNCWSSESCLRRVVLSVRCIVKKISALRWQDVPAVACVALEKYSIKLLQTPQILQHELWLQSML